MKKIVTYVCFVMLALLAIPWAHADDFKDLRAKMTVARETLVAMATDKTKRGADQQKIRTPGRYM